MRLTRASAGDTVEPTPVADIRVAEIHGAI